MVFVSSISEPFLEAVPQVHIIFLIVFIERVGKTADPTDGLATFCISVFAASYGMAKFFMAGPCRIIPYNKLNLGFLLLILNIALCLVAKATLLSVAYLDNPSVSAIGYWIALQLLPQMLFVSSHHIHSGNLISALLAPV